MKGGSIVVHELKSGHKEIWEIQSIEIGAIGEMGIVAVKSLTETPMTFMIPFNMFYALRDTGIIKIYDKEPK